MNNLPRLNKALSRRRPPRPPVWAQWGRRPMRPKGPMGLQGSMGPMGPQGRDGHIWPIAPYQSPPEILPQKKTSNLGDPNMNMLRQFVPYNPLDLSGLVPKSKTTNIPGKQRPHFRHLLNSCRNFDEVTARSWL